MSSMGGRVDIFWNSPFLLHAPTRDQPPQEQNVYWTLLPPCSFTPSLIHSVPSVALFFERDSSMPLILISHVLSV